MLKFGALPIELTPQSTQTVSATLGKDSLSFSLAVPEAMPTGPVRRAILTTRARLDGVDVTPDVVDEIAARITADRNSVLEAKVGRPPGHIT